MTNIQNYFLMIPTYTWRDWGDCTKFPNSFCELGYTPLHIAATFSSADEAELTNHREIVQE